MPSGRACLKISTRSSVGSLSNAKSARVFFPSVNRALSGPPIKHPDHVTHPRLPSPRTRMFVEANHRSLNRGSAPFCRCCEVDVVVSDLTEVVTEVTSNVRHSLEWRCSLTTLTMSKTVAPYNRLAVYPALMALNNLQRPRSRGCVAFENVSRSSCSLRLGFASSLEAISGLTFRLIVHVGHEATLF